MRFKVYYTRTVPRDLDGLFFAPGMTHVFIREVDADALGEVYWIMQGENWSPRGEARPIIRAAGVHHTSMSVGDVAVDDRGQAWLCAPMGWKTIEPLTRRLLILGCTATKKSNADRMPAIERYDGPTFRVLRKALRERAAPNLVVYVLSAKYGLIEGDSLITDYDLAMTPDRARALRPSVSYVLDGLRPFLEVYVELGHDYLAALPGDGKGLRAKMALYEHFRFYALQWGEGGIGQRCAALKRWLRCNCDHH